MSQYRASTPFAGNRPRPDRFHVHSRRTGCVSTSRYCCVDRSNSRSFRKRVVATVDSARCFEFIANPDQRIDRAGRIEPANARPAARLCEWTRDRKFRHHRGCARRLSHRADERTISGHFPFSRTRSGRGGCKRAPGKTRGAFSGSEWSSGSSRALYSGNARAQSCGMAGEISCANRDTHATDCRSNAATAS